MWGPREQSRWFDQVRACRACLAHARPRTIAAKLLPRPSADAGISQAGKIASFMLESEVREQSSSALFDGNLRRHLGRACLSADHQELSRLGLPVCPLLYPPCPTGPWRLRRRRFPVLVDGKPPRGLPAALWITSALVLGTQTRTKGASGAPVTPCALAPCIGETAPSYA